MKIAISQSNYIPWKGYFDNIAQVDTFVLYDDVQYTRRDWRNRNLIKTSRGLVWLTIPVQVSGKYFQKINETIISDPNWNKTHWNILKQNYATANRFKDVKDFVEELYLTATSNYLSEINYHFIKSICNYLNIETKFMWSSSFELLDEKTEKLVHICKQLNASEYYSGQAAKNYINETLFERENIAVHYFDYSQYPEYIQQYPPFEHGVTILDLLFNEGIDSKKYMKNINYKQ